MTLTVRLLDPERELEDFLAVIREGDAGAPSVEVFRRWLGTPSGTIRLLVGELEGHIVAILQVHDAPLAAHTLQIRLKVLKEWRGQGLGRAMWARVAEVARELAPAALQGFVLDDDPASRAWAERRGFRLVDHGFRSRLELATFDASRHRAPVEAADAAGIRFEPSDDLDRVYEMYAQMVEAAPDNVTPASRDYFEREMGGADTLRLLAVEAERWVGLTILQRTSRDQAWNAITGVVPSHRGRGLARALKLLAAEHAKARGIRWIDTGNNARNAPMLAVNKALGYRRLQGRWLMRKDLRSG